MRVPTTTVNLIFITPKRNPIPIGGDSPPPAPGVPRLPPPGFPGPSPSPWQPLVCLLSLDLPVLEVLCWWHRRCVAWEEGFCLFTPVVCLSCWRQAPPHKSSPQNDTYPVDLKRLHSLASGRPQPGQHRDESILRLSHCRLSSGFPYPPAVC